MRKIINFYYLNYPDSMPSDPYNAFSEVYVEIGDDNSNVNSFDTTYSFMVYTIDYLKNLLSDTNFCVEKSTIIVDSFDDDTIKRAIQSILDNIENYSSAKG